MDERLRAIEQANKLLEKSNALCAIANNISDIIDKNPADLQTQVALQLHAAKMLTSDGETEALAERCTVLTYALMRIRKITMPAMCSTGTITDTYHIAEDALARVKPQPSIGNDPVYGVQVRYPVSPENYE